MSEDDPSCDGERDSDRPLISGPVNYFVSLLDAAGREMSNLAIQATDDVRVVTWARNLVVNRFCASARVERRGSILTRYSSPPGAS
jgi:hypothetical protein